MFKNLDDSMLKKSLFIIGALVMTIAILVGCSPKQATDKSEKIKVSASFFPLDHFSRMVAGDLVDVVSVIPSGLDPHDYAATPKQLASIYSSHLFLYNGAGLEPWADRIRPELEAKGVRVIKMSEHVDLLSGVTGKKTRDASQSDPHIWIDPVLAQNQVELIRDAFISIDPTHADDYQKNAGEFLMKLISLDADFKEELSSCRDDTVILSHAAFQYLAKRYGFKTLSISGLSPQEEPAPKHFVELVEMAKKLGIKFIFFEKRTNPKLAETLAAEIGGETLDMLHIDGGLSPEQANNPGTYLEMMRENLKNLKIALSCK